MKPAHKSPVRLHCNPDDHTLSLHFLEARRVQLFLNSIAGTYMVPMHWHAIARAYAYVQH